MRRLQASSWALRSQSCRCRAIRTGNVRLLNTLPNVPIVEDCPEPHCKCRHTPAGLDIDRESPLNGTVPSHDMHLLISTSSAKWSSRFEDDDTLAAKVKRAFSKGGRFHSSTFTTLVSAFHEDNRKMPEGNLIALPHFAITGGKDTRDGLLSGILLESLRGRPSLRSALGDNPTQEAVEEMLERDVLPQTYFDQAGTLPSENAENRLKFTPHLINRIREPLILVCGHEARDSRCGIMGPTVLKQFRTTFHDFDVSCRSGLITHIGGHKFAGNVIIYLPPMLAFHGNDLAGMGIWYGRVEPRHVPGIVKETICKGRVVQELYRGSMNATENPDMWLQWRKDLREAHQ